MNIPQKTIKETLDFIVENCFRSLCEEKLQPIPFRQSICDLHISRLDGIRLLFIDFPKLQSLVDKSIQEIQFFRAGIADVGRSPVQSAESVGQESNL
ncbi:hypothetical protein [Methylomonas rapida]|uniref:Uncharacterized protein n=1 Tax=Methylomonas rapida TaxID=2963939 RepID=A0ABY7GCH7_9GAMM|nr:hypothetical protein [Methylomonas rapida]WAR42984.1 hypothetical protein NM686_011270 [Methylomonas rapida]WAR42997.1 hypothetical protein NM686_011335 [Methylomonas rapida]